MPYKIQLFDRERGVVHGEIAVPDELAESASASLDLIQKAARLMIDEPSTDHVHASLINYDRITLSPEITQMLLGDAASLPTIELCAEVDLSVGRVL